MASGDFDIDERGVQLRISVNQDTLGSNGSMLYDGNSFSSYPIKPCTVVDTVGCGDAFLAAWCHAILHGGNAWEGMLAGTERSAMVAAHAGAMG